MPVEQVHKLTAALLRNTHPLVPCLLAAAHSRYVRGARGPQRIIIKSHYLLPLNTTTSEADAATPPVPEETENEKAMTILSYIVLGLSWFLLVTMALFFVVFVVFRGAADQKKEEDAEDDADAENELALQAQQYLARVKLQANVDSWRRATAAAKAQRGAEISPNSPSTKSDDPPALDGVSAAEAKRLAAAERMQGKDIAMSIEIPEGWERVKDLHSGEDYYHQRGTGRTSWEHPASLFGDAIADGEATKHAAGGEEIELPSGWVAHPHAESGAVYYHHGVTNETIWEHPATRAARLEEAGAPPPPPPPPPADVIDPATGV